jgi:hypothetical protein
MGSATSLTQPLLCVHGRPVGHPDDMPDRPFLTADDLIRRAQRVAAGGPNPARILAQTITLACPGGTDPYAVLGC